MNTKSCLKCGEEKALSEFHRHKHSYRLHCKSCVRAGWVYVPRKAGGAIDGMKDCSTCLAKKPLSEFFQRANRPSGVIARCKQCTRDISMRNGEKKSRHRLRRYGLTAEQYAAMVARNGGHCGLCGGDPTSFGLSIDHDHDTGKVRDLLCNPCNAGIGMFKHNPETMERAAAYIRRHRSPDVKPTVPDGVPEAL